MVPRDRDLYDKRPTRLGTLLKLHEVKKKLRHSNIRHHDKIKGNVENKRVITNKDP